MLSGFACPHQYQPISFKFKENLRLEQNASQRVLAHNALSLAFKLLPARPNQSKQVF
jgi:hypothetical protein